VTETKLVRIGEIAARLGGVHESHAWRMIGHDPDAPKAIRISAKHTVFNLAEVEAWIDGLIEAARGKPVKSTLPDAEAIRRGAGTRKQRRAESGVLHEKANPTKGNGLSAKQAESGKATTPRTKSTRSISAVNTSWKII